MKQYQFILNTRTGTLHKRGGCRHSNVFKEIAKYYETEDAAIADEQLYMKRCKNCYKKQIYS